MYVQEIVKIQGSKKYRTVLIRESYRDGKSVHNRTVANISKLPEQCIEEIKDFFKGGKSCIDDSCMRLDNPERVQILNSKEYGASKAIIDIAKDTGLDEIIYSRKTKWSQNALAMIVGRVIYPGSKLSLTNMYLDTVLWELCGHEKDSKPDVYKDCYQPMDKLLTRQKSIQKQLANKHLHNGCIVLYDMTSTYFEGEYEDSELIKYGYSRDCKKGHQQVNIGLLTNAEGCPIAVETFAGNTQDQGTVKGQVKKLVNDFKVKEVVFVGDRGMLTPKRIVEVNKEGFKTITALTRSQMQDLISREIVKTSLFKVSEHPEVRDPDHSEIRYILCLNPKRQKNDNKTRMELINATTMELDKIRNAKIRRNNEKIGARTGKVWGKYKTEKYFKWSVIDGKLEYSLIQEVIDKEKRLDGCYIIRTDVTSTTLSPQDVYKAYKKLIHVEQAFRIIKTTSLEIRPVFHHLDARIRAHVFLCMLSYYLQWHINHRLSNVYLNDNKGKHRRWSFQQVIERLKSIRSQTVNIGNVNLPNVISTADKEQKMLLEALGTEL